MEKGLRDTKATLRERTSFALSNLVKRCIVGS